MVGMYILGNAWLAIGLYHAGVMCALKFGRGGPKRCTKGMDKVGRLYLLTIVYAAGGVLLYVLWPYTNIDSKTASEQLRNYGLNQQTWGYFFAYFCLVNPILEELFWRGYLGEDTRRPVMNDLFFAGYHALVLAAFADLIWIVPVIAACVLAGWLWRMLRMMSNELLIPVITHLAADVSIVIAVSYRVFQ